MTQIGSLSSARLPRSLRWGAVGWWAMAISSVISGLWGVYVSFAYPEMGDHYARMFAVPLIAFLHTAGGGVASLVGPLQFHGRFRRRNPALHRQLGRGYLIAVGLSGLGGLYLSPGSLAANTFGVAFIFLALAWLYTGWQAYATIRRRDVEAHKRWMIRNFALTYAAVTLRLQMPLLIVLGMDEIMALNVVGWTCWIPNLAAVEWWIRRRSGPAFRVAKPVAG